MMAEDQQLMDGAQDDDEEPSSRYRVDVEGAAETHRALSALIASRRCYTCQQEDHEPPGANSDPRPYIERIVDHCAATPDYMLPDTPLKEAIFRVVLSKGNSPITPEEISAILYEKWAMTAYPRDMSARVIRKLLEKSGAYCITRDSAGNE